MAIDHTAAPADEGSHRHGLIGMVLDIAVRFRWAIIVLTVFAAIYGALNLVRLPIDAVPDITNTQVQINTSAAALSPSQVETQVTFPIETGLAGIEGLEMTRSISPAGKRAARTHWSLAARGSGAHHGSDFHRPWRSADVYDRI